MKGENRSEPCPSAGRAALEGFLAEAAAGPLKTGQSRLAGEEVALSVPFPLAKAAVSCLTHKGVRTDSPEGRFPAPNSMTAQGNSIIKVPKAEAGLSHNEVFVLQVLPAPEWWMFQRMRAGRLLEG